MYFLLGHFVSCAWYFIGKQSEKYYSQSWILRDQQTYGTSDRYLYLRALYFALNTMTTTGYGDIVASNPMETIFMFFLIPLSSIVFAGMVSLFQNATLATDERMSRFQFMVEV